ncbi:MAG: hypothetical protein KatS3mg111_1985 [Pirellulaceae bacterium]|nr:MAG: hypothetical protein KatS3mg111_1985 [Pirellulaceae bacterium]
MSKTSRADRIQLLQKVTAKNFTPILPPEDRSVLETLLYACCLEDAPYDAADEAFGRLQESYFDWNEVRVTTITELSETLHNLPNPRAAAIRIKKNLQSIFETRYSFDLEDLRKLNQGKAVQELEKLAGMTRFVLGYVVQHALGGHAVPVSESIMNLLRMLEIVSEAEAAKGQTPGLERTIPKTKGIDFASQLHQFAVAVAQSPNSSKLKTILKDAGYVPPATNENVTTGEEETKPGPAKPKPPKKKSSAKSKAVTKNSSATKKKTAPSAKKKTGKTAKKKPR